METPHLLFSMDVTTDRLEKSFLYRVDKVFSATNYVFAVNSAYRSPEEDRRKGRSGMSYHCRGRALDLSTRSYSGSDLRRIVWLLTNAGLTVGIYKTFIHVDDRDTPILFYGE